MLAVGGASVSAQVVGLFPPRFDLKKVLVRRAMTRYGGVYSNRQKKDPGNRPWSRPAINRGVGCAVK